MKPSHVRLIWLQDGKRHVVGHTGVVAILDSENGQVILVFAGGGTHWPYPKPDIIEVIDQ